MKSSSLARGSPYGNLADRVVHYLMEHIRTNGLASGARVPSEMRVSADLQISRGIVREAYRSLRSAGILDISAGRFPRVGTLGSASFAHLLKHALATQQASAEQALDLRAAIEVRAAELAAAKRDTDDVEALAGAVRGMKRDRRDTDLFVRHDVRFHERLGAATKNPLFALVATALQEAMVASVRAGLESRSSQAQVLRVVQTHQEIVDAIAAGDPERAAATMVRHFDEARSALAAARP
jgi:DNA-binding FadR family transcriptional regulator